MIHRDYLMRMILALAQAITESISKSKNGEEDWESEAELLEATLSSATDIDGAVMLRLDPFTMATMLKMSQTDPVVIEYVARTLLLESDYLVKAGNPALAELREGQAMALANAYGFPLSKEDLYPENLEEFFEQTQKEM